MERPRERAAKVDAKRDYGTLLQGLVSYSYQGPRVTRRGKRVFLPSCPKVPKEKEDVVDCGVEERVVLE